MNTNEFNEIFAAFMILAVIGVTFRFIAKMFIFSERQKKHLLDIAFHLSGRVVFTDEED